MSTELNLIYTPATTLPESNADLVQVVDLLEHALRTAGVHNSASANPDDRAHQLNRIEIAMAEIGFAIAHLNGIDPAPADEEETTPAPSLPTNSDAPWCNLCRTRMQRNSARIYVCAHCGALAEEHTSLNPS